MRVPFASKIFASRNELQACRIIFDSISPETFRDKLTQHFNETQIKFFAPGFAVCVDEGPIPTVANNLNRSYEPNKPYKHHIQFLGLCCSQSLILFYVLWDKGNFYFVWPPSIFTCN